MTTQQARQVVVLGGGYAGATAAVRAAGRLRGRAQVTLVEPRAEFVQRLRLHQAAVGQEVRTFRLDELVGRRVEHVEAAAHAIDVARSLVRLRGGDGRRELAFDYLIVAIGSTIADHDVPGVAERAHTLADPGAAARLADALRHLPGGSAVAVVGAGLTGIEAASEIAEAYPALRVRLLTASAFGDWLSEPGRREVRRRLERLGVEVGEHQRVVAVERGGLSLADGRRRPVACVVWCAGFAANPLLADGPLATDSAGRLLVDGTLRSVSHPNVLAAGDAAAVPTLPNGGRFRMSCQAGVPSGAHAGDVVDALVRGREPEPFDLGYIAWNISLGRGDAVIQWVDRADRPRPRVLAGRRAAMMKELVVRSTVSGIRMERRVTGSLVWLRGGEPVADLPRTA